MNFCLTTFPLPHIPLDIFPNLFCPSITLKILFNRTKQDIHLGSLFFVNKLVKPPRKEKTETYTLSVIVWLISTVIKERRTNTVRYLLAKTI